MLDQTTLVYFQELSSWRALRGDREAAGARRSVSCAEESVEVEISNWLASVGRLFGLAQSFLKLFLEQVRSVLLGFDRLLEDRLTAAVLLAHRFRGGFHVIKHFRLHSRGVSNHRAGGGVDLQHGAAARARHFEVWIFLRH